MTKKALQFLVKILFYIFVVLLLVYLFVQTRQFGYLVFADQAKDRPEVAKEIVLTVEEGESLLDISRKLAKQKIYGQENMWCNLLRNLRKFYEY